MTESPNERAIIELSQCLLDRYPSQIEVARWQDFMSSGKSFLDLFRVFAASTEYRKRRGVRSAFPAGHYYSPVVDPTTVIDYVSKQRCLLPHQLNAIVVSPDKMLAFWKENLGAIRATAFPEAASTGHRFHYANGSFPYGDAIILRTMLAQLRPGRIVEVGSGYTTACMLDTLDDLGVLNTRILCIEPYADRLRSLLRVDDWSRVDLIEAPAQEAPLSIFSSLDAGDILFIDSTHVVKTGSDVHFEIFSILPVLKPGVFIHFHDVPFPFEYPDEWIFSSNHSWNEAYMLQAFLMYNQHFGIVMWNSLLARNYSADLKADFPTFLKNPGTSIWLEKLNPPC